MSTSRTNIELDDQKLALIMERYGLKTKREAVDLALDHLAGHPMTKEEVLAMEGTDFLEDVVADMEAAWK